MENDQRIFVAMSINYAQLVPVPPKGSYNTNLTYCKASTLKSLLGNPRKKYTDDCQPVTNPKVAKRIIRGMFLGHKVTGLDTAINLLQKASAFIVNDHPDIVDFFVSEGMLCCRHIRGSRTTPSNHSWGTALDFGFKDRNTGKLVVPPLGSDRTCLGHLIVRPYLYKFGWFWGAGFTRKDSMHFELANETVRKLFS